MKKVKLSKERIKELKEIEKKAQTSFDFPLDFGDAREEKRLGDLVEDEEEEEGHEDMSDWHPELDGDLICFSYDQLADGGRAEKRDKAIDPETEKAIKIAFDIP